MRSDTAGCLAKIAYATRAEAMKVYRALLRRGGVTDKMDAYHCERCSQFHLGRRKTFVRKPRDREENRAKVERYYGLVNR